MNQEEKQKWIEAFSKGGINVFGNFVMEEHAECQFGNIEPGGIGIQNNYYGSQNAPLSKSDKDIKAAIEELLSAKDENDELLFKNKKQWWAVYRVLKEHCNYPSQMNSFVTKMNELGFSEIDEGRRPTYESIKKVTGDVPQMATTTTTTWNLVKEKSENYAQQYVVAEFLMKKLAI
jgi:hypothetical protein